MTNCFHFLIIITIVTTLHFEKSFAVVRDEPDRADESEDENVLQGKNEVECDSESIIEKYVEFRKSPRDGRSYRGLKLCNHLHVLLISDPETDRAAGSMTISVGAMHDSDELPGSAHLLEHMLFMGSKKYPAENHFAKYIQENAGSYNGGTAEQWQEYHFDISFEKLSEILDIWAQFFLHPRMDPGVITREIQAVNSEHTKNKLEDYRKLFQLTKIMSKPDHPHRRFNSGNSESLETGAKKHGLNVDEKLLELHSEWYSSNIMYLAVLGKENLDDLQNMVVPLFDSVRNKNMSSKEYKEPPWGDEQLGQKVYYVPTKTARRLIVRFQIPSTWKYYKTMPADYLVTLIGHEEEGSFFNELKERNWCESLTAGVEYIPGFAFIDIQMNLTLEGMNHIDYIVKLLFQYIHLLKVEGAQEWLFNELKSSSEIKFEYKDREKPAQYVQDLTYYMLNFPFEDVLRVEIPEQYNATLIEGFLDFLIPENMNIFIASKTFEEITDQFEPWYETKYKIEKISEDLIKNMWNITELSDIFHLPAPDRFSVENFDMYPIENEKGSKFPRVIHQSRISQFWFRQDDEFKLPKLHIKFNLYIPKVCINVTADLMTSIFIDLFEETFATFAYASKLKGFTWVVKKRFCGLEISVSGFNDMVPFLLKQLLFQMTNLELKEEKFEIAKESNIRKLMDFEAHQPYLVANTHLVYLLSTPNNNHPLNDRLVAAKNLQFDGMKKFTKTLFSRVFIQGLIYGNSDEEFAKAIIQYTIEQPFREAGIVLSQEIISHRILEMADRQSQFTFEILHQYSGSSSYFGYFQLDSNRSIWSVILADVFFQIVKEKCFQVLRTKEQLGYIVYCGSILNEGILGFGVIIQSSKHPAYVNYRVEVFLQNLRTTLAEMTEEEFESERTATEKMYLKKIINQEQRFAEYWIEIKWRRYHFTRFEEKAEIIHKVQKKDIINFFEEYIYEASSKRKKLDVHVISKKMNQKLPHNDVVLPTESTKIEDPILFRSDCGVFNHTFPHLDVSFPGN